MQLPPNAMYKVMWPRHQSASNLHLVSEEDEEEQFGNVHEQLGSNNGGGMFHDLQIPLQHNPHRNGTSNSAAAVVGRPSSGPTISRRTTALGIPSRSNSMGVLSQARGGSRRATVGGTNNANNNNINNNNANVNVNAAMSTMNETFLVPHFAPHAGNNANGGGGSGNNNPFAHLTAVGAAVGHGGHGAFVRQTQTTTSRRREATVGQRRPAILAPPPIPPSCASSVMRGLVVGVGPNNNNNIGGRATIDNRCSLGGLSREVSLNLPPAASSSSSSSIEDANNNVNLGSRIKRTSGIVARVAPSPAPRLVDDHPAPTGPSFLYRLIAAASVPADWDVVLRRARSHPREACFFDPDAGGHVYALHRLLRGGEEGQRGSCNGGVGGGRMDESSSYSSSSSGARHTSGGTAQARVRPPVAVVEAVMQACPRAVTRKQAVIDEDRILAQGAQDAAQVGGGRVGGGVSGFPQARGGDDRRAEWRGQGRGQQQQHGGHPPQNNFPPAQPPVGEEEEEEEDNPDMRQEDGDEVRFEYPLAIACECDQDCEVVRLLASYLSTTKPVYRSEVFRSLDYASLPNPVVRILLEEYAGCVLERGMNSEATEGDDDDCPLEQVLFWWDDPDMMGMEEDIANYPDCDMHEDLCDLWEKLRMMLYAATRGTMDGYGKAKETFQVLHHILRIVSEGGIQDVRFPNDFAHAVLLLAKFIQREKGLMFEERDESGSLPLHIAVSGRQLLQASTSNPHSRAENGGNNEGDSQGEGNVRNDGDVDQEEAMEDDGPAEDNEAPQQQPNMPLLPPPGEQQGVVPVAGAAPQVGEGDGREGNQVPQEDEGDDEEEEEDEGANELEEDIDGASSMPSDMEIIRLLLAQHPASIRLRDSHTGSLPVHLALRNNPLAVEAIEYLIDLYPRALTMPDGEGRLPLHTALIQNSTTWEKVLGMSPSALEARDPVTGLLPFQLAAISKPKVESEDICDDASEQEQSDQEQDLDSLSTTFRLLRMNPCLASGLGDVKPRPRSLLEQQIMCRHTPRVARLEEENERLRQKVEELECKLLSMQLTSSSVSGPVSKKRKSTCASPH